MFLAALKIPLVPAIVKCLTLLNFRLYDPTYADCNYYTRMLSYVPADRLSIAMITRNNKFLYEQFQWTHVSLS